MSILAVCLPAAVAKMGMNPELFLVLFSAASVAMAVGTGALPRRRFPGPDRIPPGQAVAPLVAVLFAGLGAYFFGFAALQTWWARGAPTTTPATPVPQPLSHVALLSTLPAFLAFMVLLGGDRMVAPSVGQDLGVWRRRIGPGILKGLLGAFIVVPPLYLISQAVEILYHAIRYQHPAEHPLLKVLGERPSGAIMAAIIFGACVLAPLFEELMFRGHIQTLLKRVLRGSAGTWGAIFVTSVLFTLLHPVWSWPIIFVLALCLGYAYERTGNLWVSITMHAVFNSVSTALFLAAIYLR